MAKSSRARTRDRKKEREARRQRNRRFVIIGIVIAVVVVLVALYALSNLPADAPLPDTIGRYDDIEQGTNNDGFPVLGNPSAPVEVKEYMSFNCAECLAFYQNSHDELLSRVESEQISLVFVPRERPEIPNAEGANRAALCASEQGRFWDMYDALFHWHDTFENSAFQGNRLTSGAEALGLNMDDFNSCFNSRATSDLLNLALEDEITTVPAFAVNDSAIDDNTLAGIIETVEGILGIGDAESEAAEATEEPVIEETEAAEEAEATEAPADASAEATPEGTEED